MSRRFSPKRFLGKTGFLCTDLGIGDIADRKVPLEHCVATLHRAMDAGLNVIDTAPGYEDGYSETIVGEALKHRRDEMFLIDKIDHLREPVAPQIECSLLRLGLSHVDLFVFHGCSRIDDWLHLAATGGGMDQLEHARHEGKLRFRGISSHNPDVLVAAIRSGLCDVVMFPIGPYADPRYESDVLPLAKLHQIGTVCFKTFGAGKLLGDTSGYNRPLASRPRGKVSSGGVDESRPTLPCLSVEECLHYTLTVGPDVALLGMSFPNEQDAAFTACDRYCPLPEPKLADIRRRAAEAVKGKGDIWWNPGGH